MSSVCGSDVEDARAVAAEDIVLDPDEEIADDVKELDATKAFYVQNNRFLLTYSTHLPKLEYFKFLEIVNGGNHLKECYVAHEKASSKTDYEHTHVYVDFGRQIKSKSSRKFDFRGIHPNIKFVTTRKVDRILRYISKEDPELAELAKKYTWQPSIVEAIRSAKTKDEMLKHVKRPADIFGAERIFDLTREEEPLRCAQFVPHGWQIPLLRKLEWTADLRSIDNYWEPDGECGKTILIKYLVATDPTRFASIADPGPARDTATVIVTARAAGWKGHCMLVNLTRDFVERDHIYKFLETLKDGLVTAQKYESATMVFDNPHVIVFSNAPLTAARSPGDTRLRISKDRIRNHRIVVTDEDRARWQPPPPQRVIRFACLAELDGDEEAASVAPSEFLSSEDGDEECPPEAEPMSAEIADLYDQMLSAYAEGIHEEKGDD